MTIPKSASHDYINIEKQIEEKTKNKDISITILRPTMIYGSLSDHNISTFIRMVDKLRLFPVVNKAEYELQPVHASDLGKAYYQVLINTEQTSNKNYDLSGGKPIKLIDIFKTIEKYLGKKIIYISFPFWFAYSGACLLYCFSFGKKDYREKVQRLVEPRVYSHEEAKKDFGYNPMSFDIGVKEEVNEYIKVKTGDEIVS